MRGQDYSGSGLQWGGLQWVRITVGGAKTEALNLENYGKDLYLKSLINSTFFQPHFGLQEVRFCVRVEKRSVDSLGDRLVWKAYYVALLHNTFRVYLTLYSIFYSMPKPIVF